MVKLKIYINDNFELDINFVVKFCKSEFTIKFLLLENFDFNFQSKFFL